MDMKLIKMDAQPVNVVSIITITACGDNLTKQKQHRYLKNNKDYIG